ncbi:hypothetical protein Tco_1447102 [Tanacetum coccineum]
MNPRETLQVAARDEKWVPSAKRNSTYFKAFTISVDVLEIFMQKFWTILDICPRVEGVDFIDVPDDDTTLTFLFDLGYKGLLNRDTNILNVDYPELIWEDFAYQINQRKEKRSRHENMLYPRFIQIIINHFLKQHKSLTILNHKHYHTIKDDVIVSRLKFVKIGEDYQEYGHPIPNVMLTNAIKGSESYQMSEPEPDPAKKKISSRRVVKKKVALSANDNIISDDPDAALELAKSISETKAKNQKQQGKCSIFTPAKKEAANIMQALKESKKTIRRQLCTGGSNEGTGSKPGVLDESTIVSATSSEGTGAKPRVPDEDKDITEEKVILEWGDEQDSEHFDDDNDDAKKDEKDGDADDEGDDHVSDKQDDDDEDEETKYDEDDIFKYKIRVRKDEDEEMKDAEVEGSDKGDEEITDIPKEEAEKTLEAKEDTKKTELPPSSSSLSVSLGFGDQFLKLSSDSSLVSTVKDSADADIPVLVIPETTNLPPIPKIVTKTPVITTNPSSQVTPIISTVQQTTTPIPTPTITTVASTVTITVSESNALTAVELRVAKLEKDVLELKTVDHSSESLAVL